MNVKITIVLCLVVYINAKALQLNEYQVVVLNSLGLGYKDQYDYNSFILGVETVVEAAQTAAIDTIEQTVDVAQEFARVVRSIGIQQNIKGINAIQSDYFQRIEDMRHRAYDQKLDISSCALTAVQDLNTESRKSINNVTNILTTITDTFSAYSQVTYADPADQNLEKTYTIRERIYKCPFSFTDFTPFYVCLTATAVLQDIVILNKFTAALNDTLTDIRNLVYEYSQAASLYQGENVASYKVTAALVYDNKLVPCAQKNGYQA